MNQRGAQTRKLITMHNALHPKDDIDKLYGSRKEKGRGLAGIVNCVDATFRGHEEYKKKKSQESNKI